MSRKTDVQIAIMDALKHKSLNLFELTLQIDLKDSHASMGSVGSFLRELVDDGYVVETKSENAVAPAYAHAHVHAMSDLRRKLLPMHDPVHTAHEWEATRAVRSGRGVHPSVRASSSADLDFESS